MKKNEFDLEKFNKIKKELESLYEMGAITLDEKVNILRKSVGLESLKMIERRFDLVVPRPIPNQGQTITKGVDISPTWILVVFGIIIIILIVKNCL